MSESTTNGHGEQSIPLEWGVARWGDERFVVRDVPEGMAELYRIQRQSDNPRALIRADAVIYNGMVVTAEYDEDLKAVQFYHDYAGRRGRVPVDEPIDEPAFMLKSLHVATSILDFPGSQR